MNPLMNCHPIPLPYQSDFTIFKEMFNFFFQKSKSQRMHSLEKTEFSLKMKVGCLQLCSTQFKGTKLTSSGNRSGPQLVTERILTPYMIGKSILYMENVISK